MATLKIKDYEPVRVFTGEGFEIGLYKKENEYIIYRHAARGKSKNFVGNYEFIDNDNVSLNYSRLSNICLCKKSTK